VVTPRRLTLRSQSAPVGKESVAIRLPVARVWVNSGVFHLDTPFDYWVPERLSDIAIAGVRVQVEFGSSIHEGLILERLESAPSTGTLKYLLGVISIHVVATHETIELFRLSARRWAGTPYDIIRSAIPPRVASVDREEFSQSSGKALVKRPGHIAPRSLVAPVVRAFWSMPASQIASEILASLIVARADFGQVLVIVPDERKLLSLEKQLLEHVSADRIARLDGHATRSDRYRNYLRVTKGNADIAIGLRGAIFTPLLGPATIIVIGESSELLYELRSPGWNVRDVAVLRSMQTEVNLIFAGFSPSLEVGRLIDTGWLSLVSSSQRRSVVASAQVQGELLSSTAFGVVRTAIKEGPILFLVPRKGYGNAVLCKKCRNVATCHCGGRLLQSASGKDPQCVLCLTIYPFWKCLWCQGGEIYIASRGIDRFVEEIGRSFPNIAVINSSGDHIVDSVPSEPILVVATPGSEPDVEGGYAAVLLLEGLRFFGHTDLRSGERAREQFFLASSLVSPRGPIFVSLDPTHPIVNALTRWNPAPMVRKEMQERQEVALPPYYRFITIELDSKEASGLKAGLLRSQNEGRISEMVRINGPYEKPDGKAGLSLSSPLDQAEGLVDFVHEVQRRRNVSKKSLLTLRVDPYSLS
jgi:primosomal protein N' (replication factor Y)